MKLKKPKNDKEVKWGEGTIDNEHMNKKKSKCKWKNESVYGSFVA